MFTNRNPIVAWRFAVACRCLVALLAAFAMGMEKARSQKPLPVRITPVTAVYCKPATSFAAMLHLTSTTADTQVLTLEMTPNPYFRMVPGAPQSITLAPADSLAVPLRFVNTWGRINGAYHLELLVRAAKGGQQAVSVPVVLEGGIEPGVYAEVMQDKMLVLPGATVVSLPVHIRSMLPGNTLLYLTQQPGPHSLKLAGSPLAIRLPPVRDTLLSLAFTCEKNRDPAATQPIVLQVHDAAGKVWTTFNFVPQLLVSSRSFYQAAPAPAGLTMSARYSALGSGSYQTEYQWALMPVANELPLSAQMSYQEEQPYGIRRMQNTWVQYRHNKFRAVAGSQSGFHELSLQGRGLMASYNSGNNKVQTSGWLIDQNPNLLAPLGKGYHTERIASGQVVLRGTNNGHTLVNGSWFNRQQNHSAGQLVFAEWQSARSKRQELLLRVGLSREQFSLADTTLRGWSGRLEWKHTGPKTQWFAAGQLAAPTYSGQMRGQSQLTVQAVHQLAPNQALLLRLSTYRLQTAPGLTKIYGSNQFIVTQSAEADYSVRWGLFTGQLRTYLLQQQQMLPLMLGQARLASFSPRTALSLSGKAGPVFFNTLWDGGWQQAAFDGARQAGTFAWKANSQVSWKTVALQASVQQGAYYLAELLDQAYTGRPFGNLMFSGAYNCNLGRQAALQASVFATRNNVQQNWLGSGMVQGHWQVRTHWYGSALLLFQQNTGVQGSLGIQHKWALKKRPPTSTRFTLQLFEDINGNGTRETGENVAADRLVEVDGVLLITSKQGILRIRHIAKGSHRIRILSKGSASKAMLARSVEVRDKDELLLGIPPVFTLQGRVKANKDRYTGISESVGGIKVVMAGADGEQVAFTREDGLFVFEVAAGAYRVFLNQQQATSTHIYIDPQSGFTGTLELVWTAGERPVQVKKVKIQ